MGVKVAALYAALGLDKRDYDKGLDQAESKSKGWAGRIGGLFKSAGKVVAVGLAAGIAGLTAFGAVALGNAEDQERANSRVKAVFGDLEDTVNGWAAHNSRAMGVNDDVLQQAQVSYAQFATNSGMSLTEAMQNGQALITRAEEIARSTGASFEDVYAKLMKGVQGSTRGLKEYGVQAGPTTIAAEALRLGLIKQGEAVDDNAKTLALQSLIMKQTASYTASAGEATDSFAYKQRQMGVMVDEIMDTLGVLFMNLAQVVMPILVQAMGGLSDWVTANMPTIQAVFETAIGVITWAFTNVLVPAIQTAGEIITWLVTNVVPPIVAFFQDTGPSAVNAFGGVIDWLVVNVLPVLATVFDVLTTVVLPALVAAFSAVVSWVQANWPAISSVVGQVAGAVSTAFQVIAAIIKAVWPVIEAVAKVLFPILGVAASILLNAMDGAFKLIGGIWQTAADVAKTVVGAVKGAWDGLVGFFSSLWSSIGGIVKGGINVVIGAINGMIDLLNGIQIHIPEVGVGPVHTPRFDWNGLNIGHIGYLAKGTRDWAGGLAWVGENGPELMSVPKHAQVYSNAESRGMMSGKVEVVLRDPDGAIARGGYSQADLERAVTAGIRDLLGGAAHAGARS
jgi:hypothetical protein